MLHSRSRPRSGFSLVEVLIGATILAIAMLGAFSAHVAADKLTRESEEKEIARGILESAMQRVLLEGAATLAGGDVYAPGEEIAIPETVLLEDTALSFGTPGYVAGDPAPAVLTVQLVLSWTSDSGIDRTLSLTSATR